MAIFYITWQPSSKYSKGLIWLLCLWPTWSQYQFPWMTAIARWLVSPSLVVSPVFSPHCYRKDLPHLCHHTILIHMPTLSVHAVLLPSTSSPPSSTYLIKCLKTQPQLDLRKVIPNARCLLPRLPLYSLPPSIMHLSRHRCATASPPPALWTLEWKEWIILALYLQSLYFYCLQVGTHIHLWNNCSPRLHHSPQATCWLLTTSPSPPPTPQRGSPKHSLANGSA